MAIRVNFRLSLSDKLLQRIFTRLEALPTCAQNWLMVMKRNYKMKYRRPYLEYNSSHTDFLWQGRPYDDDQYALSLTVYLIGKYSIAMVMTTVYVYTTELYPTKYRHSLFAFSSMIGRIGSIVAPLTPAFGEAIWENFPFALFGGFALVAGALVLVTPETLGAKLPDTMEEASNIGVQKSSEAGSLE